jgi:hypothetical protein
MNVVKVQHTVADFGTWKVGYDADEVARRASGCTSATISRAPVGADGSNEITALLQFPKLAAAQGFNNPALPEAMKAAGVVGTPEIQITGLVESVSY